MSGSRDDVHCQGPRPAAKPIARRLSARYADRRKNLKRGIESDVSYYFDTSKLAAFAAAFARRSNKIKDYPNPDLAVEIAVSPSKIDRTGIYAALRVPEIWRFETESVAIEQLTPAGIYVAAASSRFLHVRPNEVARWIYAEESPRGLAWEQRLREWVRNEVALRLVLPGANKT